MKYNESRIVLMVQKFDRVYCYFNICENAIEEYEKKFGKSSYGNSKAIVNLYIRQGVGFNFYKKLEVDPFTDNWYIELDHDDVTCYVSYARQYEGNLPYEIACSNIVTTPRNHVSGDNNIYYINTK